MKLLHEHAADISKALVSTGISAVAVISSFQEQLESWLRICSLVGAIIVSVLTVVSIVRKARKP